MRRVMLITAMAAFVLIAVAFAFKSGNYNGTTGKGGAVSFKASQSKVTSFKVAVKLRCSNGASAANTTTVSAIPIRSSRFSSVGGPATIKGSLNGSKASGTVAVTIARLPNGRNCTSGSLAWNAKRGGAAGGGLTCTATGSFNGGDLQVDFGCDGEFDGFTVHVPRPPTRADASSTAHVVCNVGTGGPPGGAQTPIVDCSAQDGVRLRSGRVLIRFSTNADCSDASKTTVEAGRVGATSIDGPFALKTTGC